MHNKGTSQGLQQNSGHLPGHSIVHLRTSGALLAHHLVFFCVSRPIPGSAVHLSGKLLQRWLCEHGRGWSASSTSRPWMAGGRAGPPGQDEQRVGGSDGSEGTAHSYHVDSYTEEPATRAYDVDGVREAPLAAGRGAGSTTLHQSAPDCAAASLQRLVSRALAGT